MIELTVTEVASAVGGAIAGDGRAADDVTITGVAIDSRAVAPGDLFVALAGERTDGHDHAGAAVAAGAAAVLCQRDIPDVPVQIVVDDTVAALGALAHHVLDRLPNLTVVGITGSSGKTSTKDLLADVLSSFGSTVAPPGSFNNELGLPLTVLRCDPETRFLVLEMGARGRGHIAYLCSIAQPHIGVALNVGHAHVGEFGSQAAIAEAKSEIVAGLPADGIAVLNADDPLVRGMAGATQAPVMTFGEAPGAEVRFDDVRLDDLARASFTLHHGTDSAAVTLPLSGAHMVSNAAAAAAVALGVGMPLADVAAALSAAQPRSRWRMEVTETPDGVTIINDAYNANPESMRAALKALADMGRRGDGRTWAVLGEMLELGDESMTAHDSIGRLAVRLNISRLIAVGDGARPIHLGAGHEGSWDNESAWVPDVDTALATLREEVQTGDIVLVKASRAVGLERIAAQLGGGEAT